MASDVLILPLYHSGGDGEREVRIHIRLDEFSYAI